MSVEWDTTRSYLHCGNDSSQKLLLWQRFVSKKYLFLAVCPEVVTTTKKLVNHVSVLTLYHSAKFVDPTSNTLKSDWAFCIFCADKTAMRVATEFGFIAVMMTCKYFLVNIRSKGEALTFGTFVVVQAHIVDERITYRTFARATVIHIVLAGIV